MLRERLGSYGGNGGFVVEIQSSRLDVGVRAAAAAATGPTFPRIIGPFPIGRGNQNFADCKIMPLRISNNGTHACE